MVNSPIWKPRVLILLVLLSCLLPVESAKPNKLSWLRKLLQNDESDLEKEFLYVHNSFRAQNAEPPFTWDPKLAFYAKQYALQHHVDCQLVHSNGPYGENLFWGSGPGVWTPSAAVEEWYGEIKYYNRASNTCQDGQMCGHYTQIVWRDSTQLGCARNVCQNGGTYIVCEYDPPGNYVNESPFDKHI